MKEHEYYNGTHLLIFNERLTLIQKDNFFGLHLDGKKTLIFKRKNQKDFELFNDNRLEFFFEDKINQMRDKMRETFKERTEQDFLKTKEGMEGQLEQTFLELKKKFYERSKTF